MGPQRVAAPGYNANAQLQQFSQLHATAARNTQQQQPAALDSESPAFDNADFPALTAGGANVRGNFVAGNDPYSLQARKAASTGNVLGEFSMQSEDFPALTTQNGGQEDNMRLFNSQLMQKGFGNLIGRGNPPVNSERMQAPEQLMRLQQMSQGGAKQGGDAKPVASSSTDRYGLLGLLHVIRMTDADLTMLALGTDLTGLGLNLNAADSLFKTFVSPLADNPIKAEPEWDVPACYKHPAPRLHPGYLAKFKEETLFYIFYSMPQDEAQIIAADELNSRGWAWHKKFRCWLIKAPNAPCQKFARGERGTFLFFDTSIWDVVQKSDVEIHYDDLEAALKLPRRVVQPGQQH